MLNVQHGLHNESTQHRCLWFYLVLVLSLQIAFYSCLFSYYIGIPECDVGMGWEKKIFFRVKGVLVKFSHKRQ